MTTQTAAPELREVEKRPFGIYAIILLMLFAAAAAALDIVRLRIGFPTVLLSRVGEFLQQASSLSGITHRLVSDERILIWINGVIIVMLLVSIVGLWFRERDAWIMAMILIGIGLVYNIWSYLEGDARYFNMLIHVVAVFYLNERSVQLVYERRTAGAE